MSILITPCTKADLHQITQLENQIFCPPYTPTMIKNLLIDNNTITLKATKSNQIVGYIAIQHIFNQAELIKIAVNPSFTRQKIALNLMQNAIKILKSLNVDTLFLEVAQSNTPAISLYKALDFATISTRKKYYANEDALIMQKNLQI